MEPYLQLSCLSKWINTREYDVILVVDAWSEFTSARTQSGSTNDILQASIALNREIEKVSKNSE